MTIETKYNIGDEVWFTTQYRRPVKAKIIGIHIVDKSLCLRYLFDEYSPRLERYLFPTKEELIKSFLEYEV